MGFDLMEQMEHDLSEKRVLKGWSTQWKMLNSLRVIGAPIA
jgi:hypothetical protein